MPPKKKPEPLMEPGAGVAYGWAFKWNNQGWCTVGTAGTGPLKRFSFELTRYDAPADPGACVLAQLLERNKGPGPTATADEIEEYQALLNDAAAVEPRHIELSSLGASVIGKAGDTRSHKATSHFMHSEHSVRGDYESRRLDFRHVASRDVSYAEAVQTLEEMGMQSEAWLHEVHHYTSHPIHSDLIRSDPTRCIRSDPNRSDPIRSDRIRSNPIAQLLAWNKGAASPRRAATLLHSCTHRRSGGSSPRWTS